MAQTLPFFIAGPGEEFEEDAEAAVREAVPCTEDNKDYDYDTPVQEESFREDRSELVVK